MHGPQKEVSQRERENGGKGNMSARSFINIYIKDCQTREELLHKRIVRNTHILWEIPL